MSEFTFASAAHVGLHDFNLTLRTRERYAKGLCLGLFDEDGKKGVYGCLNKITPEIARAAVAEAKDEISISLNWPIRALKKPSFFRKGLVHRVLSFLNTPIAIHGYDNEVEFNTQCSSQWDSLCHFYHQPTQRGYNGANPSIKDLIQDWGNEEGTKTLLTLNHWHERGGLVGRGVLIDYKAYAEANGIKYSPFEPHKITIADIEAIARRQSVTFKQGDNIIVRTGLRRNLAARAPRSRRKMLGTHKAVGVEGTEEVAKWFWKHHFAAVAADNCAFEVLPPAKDGVDAAGSPGELVLRQHFLGLLGLNFSSTRVSQNLDVRTTSLLS